MGACQFSVISVAHSAEAAFNSAVEQAQYDHGHSGYTGTIAEKRSFQMVDEKILTDHEIVLEPITLKYDGKSFERMGIGDETREKIRILMDTLTLEESQFSSSDGPAACIEILAPT